MGDWSDQQLSKRVVLIVVDDGFNSRRLAEDETVPAGRRGDHAPIGKINKNDQ